MEEIYIPLNKVNVGQTCIIKELKVTGKQRRRLLDLGFIKDTQVKVIRKSPLGDPTAYLIRKSLVALRKEEASNVLVEIISD
ncbi:MAG TPA: FeoA family protein [Defluviitaleaceae bacterium]|nr:ferrous iron transport protein A [Candidatus Epulonipiscium sp.]HOA81894.1 FeoA family protein [Defluviitaleaceae bacterium]